MLPPLGIRKNIHPCWCLLCILLLVIVLLIVVSLPLHFHSHLIISNIHVWPCAPSAHVFSSPLPLAHVTDILRPMASWPLCTWGPNNVVAENLVSLWQTDGIRVSMFGFNHIFIQTSQDYKIYLIIRHSNACCLFVLSYHNFHKKLFLPNILLVFNINLWLSVL